MPEGRYPPFLGIILIFLDCSQRLMQKKNRRAAHSQADAARTRVDPDPIPALLIINLYSSFTFHMRPSAQ